MTTPSREQVYRDVAPLVRRLVENYRAKNAAGAPRVVPSARPAGAVVARNPRATSSGSGLTERFQAPTVPARKQADPAGSSCGVR